MGRVAFAKVCPHARRRVAHNCQTELDVSIYQFDGYGVAPETAVESAAAAAEVVLYAMKQGLD